MKASVSFATPIPQGIAMNHAEQATVPRLVAIAGEVGLY